MGTRTCLQCGTATDSPGATFCRRCGLPYGAPPRRDAELPTCHICYRTAGDDGRLPSLESPAFRVDLQRHLDEHDRHPVGDDDWLETLREGDQIRIGRWTVRFDTARRYLVTGALDAGRRRAVEHSALVTAMAQVGRWGTSGPIVGDQQDWAAARDAVSRVMERYHRSA
jgi:hypothetical protein